MGEMRENITEAVAKIIDPFEWEFCNPDGRKMLVSSVPHWQRQIWCKDSIRKARQIIRLLECGVPE